MRWTPSESSVTMSRTDALRNVYLDGGRHMIQGPLQNPRTPDCTALVSALLIFSVLQRTSLPALEFHIHFLECGFGSLAHPYNTTKYSFLVIINVFHKSFIEHQANFFKEPNDKTMALDRHMLWLVFAAEARLFKRHRGVSRSCLIIGWQILTRTHWCLLWFQVSTSSSSFCFVETNLGADTTWALSPWPWFVLEYEAGDSGIWPCFWPWVSVLCLQGMTWGQEYMKCYLLSTLPELYLAL